MLEPEPLELEPELPELEPLEPLELLGVLELLEALVELLEEPESDDELVVAPLSAFFSAGELVELDFSRESVR